MHKNIIILRFEIKQNHLIKPDTFRLGKPCPAPVLAAFIKVTGANDRD